MLTHLETVPTECLLRICELTDPWTVGSLAQVSKYMNHVLNKQSHFNHLKEHFHKILSVRLPYPGRTESCSSRALNCPENSIHLGAFLVSGGISRKLYKLGYDFGYMDSIYYGHEPLIVIDANLDNFRTCELHPMEGHFYTIGNAPNHEDPGTSPYICVCQQESFEFRDTVTGNIVYSVAISPHTSTFAYSGNYLVIRDRSCFTLIEIDFAAKQHRFIWTISEETDLGFECLGFLRSLEARINGNFVVIAQKKGEVCFRKLVVLDRESGEILWRRGVGSLRLFDLFLSKSFLTLYGSSAPRNRNFDIRHFDLKTGAEFVKDPQRTSAEFDCKDFTSSEECGLVLVGDDFLIGCRSYEFRTGNNSHRYVPGFLFIMDFLRGTKTNLKLELDQSSGDQIGIAFRETPFGPIRIKLRSIEAMKNLHESRH